jgi:hypothetical protein
MMGQIIDTVHSLTVRTIIFITVTAVTVTGVLGRSVLLPCNTSAPLTDTDRVVLILWYKESIDTPIYR